MAMLDQEALKKGFRNHLNTNVAAFATIVAQNRLEYGNRKVVPPTDGSIWAREILLPTAETKVASGTIEALGRMQYMFLCRKGAGTESLSTLVKDVSEALEASTDIALTGLSGQFAHIDRTERLEGQEFDDTWYAVTVSSVWRAYTAAKTL